MAATVQILYDGTDITGSVLLEGIVLRSSAGGAPGIAQLALKDTAQNLAVVSGKSLEVKINGSRAWAGYVINNPLTYFFDGTAKPISQTPRRVGIVAVDNNILLAKRVLYDKTTPTNMQLTTYAAGTNDDVIIKQYIADHSDLAADGVTTTLVEHVGTPSTDSEISGAAGWTVADFLAYINANIGAIYYLDPDKQLVYTDVDTVSAPFGITDAPADIFYLDEFDRTATGSLGDAERYVADGDVSDFSVSGGVAKIAAGGGGGSFVWEGAPEAHGYYQFDFWIPADVAGDNGSYIELDTREISGVAAWVALYPNGDGTWTASVRTASGSSEATFTPDASSWYTLKLLVDATAAAVKVRAWKRGTTEPSTWDIEGTALTSASSSWTPYLIAFSPSGEDGQLDNLRVTPSVTEVGCRELEITKVGAKLANEALVWGAGQGSAGVVFGHVTDGPSVTAHQLWQRAQFLPSVFKQATVNRVADSIVYGSPQNRRGAKDDAEVVSCVVFDHGLLPGQKVSVRSAVWGFTDVLPIRSVEITFPSGIPQYALELSHDIDPPWATSEFFFPGLGSFPGVDLPDIDVRIPNIELWTPWLPPFDPCAEGPSSGCVDDAFQRTTAAGTGWGTADSGQSWTIASAGNGTQDIPSSGAARIMGVGAATGTFDTTSNAQVGVCDAAANGGVLATFTLSGSTWDSTAPFCQDISAPGSPTLGYSPSTTADGSPGTMSLESGVVVEPLAITLGGGIGTAVYLFNSGGRWYMTRNATLMNQYEPVDIGAAITPGEYFAVRAEVFAGKLRARAWRYTFGTAPTDSEPTTWDIQEHGEVVRSWSGSPAVGYRVAANAGSIATHSVFCHSFEAYTIATAGDAMGMFSGGSGGSCIDTFSRTESGGWGTSEIGPAWQVGDGSTTHVSVDGSKGLIGPDTVGEGHLLFIDRGEVVMPIEQLVLFTVAWSKNSYYWEVVIGFDSPPNALSDSDWAWLVIDGNSPSGLGNNDLSVRAMIDSSLRPSTSGIADIAAGTVSSNTEVVSLALAARFRLDSSGMHVKLWKQSDSEPAGWTDESTDDHSGLAIQQISQYVTTAGGASSADSFAYTVDSIELSDGCTGGGDPCVDDFDRAIARTGDPFNGDSSGATWGASDLGGDWVFAFGDGNLSTVSVEGGAGVFWATYSSNPDSGPVLDLPLALTSPTEILVKMRFLTNAAWTYDGLGESVGTSFDLSLANASLHFGPDIGDGTPQVAWLSVGGGFGGPANSSDDAVLSNIPDQWVWIRWQLDATGTRARVWFDGDAEPGTWQVDGNGDSGITGGDTLSVSCVAFQDGLSEGPPGQFEKFIEVDSIRIVQGMECGGNPCGTVDEPDPDPPTGYVCESPVEISPPPARPPEDTYFQLSSSFQPASARVWMQGKLLRYIYDYTEIYTEGIIEIDDAVIAAADPGALDVYVCYYAEPVFLGVV